MRLVVLLLMCTCLVAKEAERKDKLKEPHEKPKQKHRQWLKHPLYIPPGKHFIDESIQPGKQDPKKQTGQVDYKTNGPNPSRQYKTGQTGFKIPFYDPKTGQVGHFAYIPAYRRKTGKTGFKTVRAGYVPISMYTARIGKTGFKKFPLYKTKTGQAGYVPIPIYMARTGKTGFKKFPLYKSKTGQAGYVPIPMYMARTGKTGFKKFQLYKTKTGHAGFIPIPMYKAKTGKKRFKNYLFNTKTGQAGFVPIPMYGVNLGKENNPLNSQNGLAMYQMMSGQPVQLASAPGILPYNAGPSSLVPLLDTPSQQAEPMYLISPPVQGMDTPPLAANQMSMMYPTGLTGETGLTGFENGLANQQGLSALPGFLGVPLASPELQASEALAESVLGQANAQAKSIISGPKKQNRPSFTVSVNGVVRSVIKQDGAAVNLDADGATISLSKKNKVSKQINKKKGKKLSSRTTL